MFNIRVFGIFPRTRNTVLEVRSFPFRCEIFLNRGNVSMNLHVVHYKPTFGSRDNPSNLRLIVAQGVSQYRVYH